jgi:PAS domain S-box-containing protein
MTPVERRKGRFESLLQHAPLGLFSASPDGRIERANEALERLLGYEAGELADRPVEDLTLPEDRPEERKLFGELRAGRRDRFELQERCRRKDGGVLWAELAVCSFRDKQGRLRHAVGALEDITARKLAEDAAKRMSYLVESAQDAVVAWDTEGSITAWSAGARRLFGYSASEVSGLPVTFNIPASRMLETIQLRERCLRGEKVVSFESERLRKDGRIVEVAGTMSVIRDAAGVIIGASAILRDLTERRKAEAALQRLAAVVSSASDAVAALDLRSVVTDWNPAAERLFGWKAEEMVGREVMEVAPAELLPEMNRLREEVLAGRRVEGVETRLMRKDGSPVEVRLTVAPIFDPRGRIIGSSAIAHDITARKRAQERIRRVNAELESRVTERTAELLAANLELDSFNASISHDLRGPLATLRLSLDLLARLNTLDDEGRRLVERSRRSARRMDQLIDDMMQLAKCRAAELRRERVDLTALARGIVAELRQREPARRVTFICAEGLSCRADRRLLKAALENLLGNAWKFTGRTRDARIELGVRRDGEETVFFVADNGAGFDMAYAPKLFRSFIRLHSRQEFEGTGIGLSIVRSIVGRHGGRVWASAAVGRGATFFFTLPEG